MALVFMDGFDHYDNRMAAATIQEIFKKWTTYAWGNPATTLEVRPGYCRPPGGQGIAVAGWDGPSGVVKVLSGNYATFVLGCHFNLPVNVVSNVPIIAFYDWASGIAGTCQMSIRLDTSGHLTVCRNSTVLATSSNVLSVNTWYHLEFKATISDTAGAYELRINGSSTGWVPAASSANTRGQGSNNYVNAVAIMGGAQGGMSLFDDLYFLDTTGSVANTFIGPQKIITIFPNSVGAQTDWTGNYAANFANVNEAAGDGDSTFNQDSIAGHIDLFGFDDVPAGTISAIQHVLEARQDAGAARVLRAKTRIGTTNYDGTSKNLAGNHVYLTDPVTVSPASSAAWTTDELNAAQFGYELVS